jgi:hypothetical protein
MDDIDRVFARFKDDKPEPADRRETLSIPRRSGAGGSRVVEVVHVRSGGAIKDRPRRVAAHVHAASWDGGFPAKRPVVAPILVEPTAVEAALPTAHVMPAWEPAVAKEQPRLPPVAAQQVEARRPRGRPRKEPASALTRHIADPFDSSDDGANCMRCGYAIEPAREKRGLMTCGECG